MAGGGGGNGRVDGRRPHQILLAAGLEGDGTEVLFTGADRGVEGEVEQNYQRSLDVDAATSSGVLLAYDLNGAPLPPQHGFPLRVVVPGWYGMTNVKWLTDITVLDSPFTGYQQSSAYRLRQAEDDVGEPLSRMVPRSLMVPPGIPDFFTRSRVLHAGSCEVAGRAWSGTSAIATMEMSTDGGRTWESAALDRAAGPGAWQGWHYRWDAEPGDYELCCRATDQTGAQQPLRPDWNYGGYLNNAVHTVKVHVGEA